MLPALTALLISVAPPTTHERAAERELMVLTVQNMAATAGEGNGKISAPVANAMRKVPRHLFVPEEVRREAYRNVPLPIGHEATISQPYIVALMTDLLAVKPGEKVLEVGTGSGYQAAILSALGARVFSIEIVEPLARRAAAQLRTLGYGNVEVRAGDGYLGWPEQKPFDKIIVTAGADHVPKPLLDQLRPGGRMVIPVGRQDDLQLTLITKDKTGKINRRCIIPVRFVPLTRN